jgi:hypothetical protein
MCTPTPPRCSSRSDSARRAIASSGGYCAPTSDRAPGRCAQAWAVPIELDAVGQLLHREVAALTLHAFLPAADNLAFAIADTDDFVPLSKGVYS